MLDKITPKQKRLLVWLIGGGIIILVVTLFNPEDRARAKRDNPVVKHVLTDFNTREIGVDSIAANLKLVHDREERLSKELSSLRKELELIRKNAGLLNPNGSEHVDFASKFKEMQELINEFKVIKALLPKNLTAKPEEVARPNRATEVPNQTVYQAPVRAIRTIEARSDPTSLNSSPSPVNNQAKTLGSTKKTPEVAIAKKAYVPAGSVMSGILITGLDAPTQEEAKREPFPVLINITSDTMLPNDFRVNMKECFVIAAGFGDMSSERVYLRAESLSCVTRQGKVVEAKLNAYATGEDGKAGLRGRLVSKQGKLIARSLLAGFLEGLSGAFDVNPVPVLSTTSTAETQYQSVYNSKALQGAAVAGSSKALERIASFYLKLAQDMFPVLEVDAARRVDLIVTQGFSFENLESR